MNPFEKIFNYQVISRLKESGAITLTSHERAWLKTMLSHPAAADAFTPATLEKLRELLADEESIDLSRSFIEKAKSVEKQVYHPLLRKLRRILERRQGIRITYTNNHRRIRPFRAGVPYKLQYSLAKREWYLLWYDLRNETIKSTRFAHIRFVEESALSSEKAMDLFAQIDRMWESRKEQAKVEVIPVYNKELSRILYAFSCFDKYVDYDDETDTYCITLTFLADEREYILSRLRFLGKRVKVVEGSILQQRMLESAAMALARYGIERDR